MLVEKKTASTTLKVALVGNPNSGKSSLFNLLTGLNQKVGNFPGVTVDKRVGTCSIHQGFTAEILDLPGTYSIYPRSADEQVVFEVLGNEKSKDHPDVVVVVVDMTNLERSLLLFTQIKDMGLPVILVLNMSDVAQKRGIQVDVWALRKAFSNTPIITMNARSGEGIDQFKAALQEPVQPSLGTFFNPKEAVSAEIIETIKDKCNIGNDYRAYQLLHQDYMPDAAEFIAGIKKQNEFDPQAARTLETTTRYQQIQQILQSSVKKPFQLPKGSAFTQKLDRIFTHKVFGYSIFFGLLFLIFQAIFAWATVPMDLIDVIFTEISVFIKNNLPEGVLTDLVAEGIIPGIGGIVIFIPQIAILFAFIAILEETGYMARVVFLMDRVMRKFGLNGRSVVPLISGVACAIPAIMATRSIESWKDRLITIFVTPLMSCSARLPVYTILIALVVPDQQVWGFINLQGITLMGMYLLGFFAAMVSALVMKFIIQAKERSFLIMELPAYKSPRWKNVGLTVVEKSKTFVVEAGKIILAISIVLWVLASYGPGNRMEEAVASVPVPAVQTDEAMETYENTVASQKLENSYAGMFGKAIEPAIRPLGYDWKIGIALITSFAAREVFVATIATLYSVGNDFEDEATIKSRLKAEINPDTGGPRYTLAVAFSLLVFYAFAMQCMSTVAVVYRETKGWKWPVIQTIYMTVLAYVSALIVYQLLS
jgi:ferrous iron transport protein B